jgi:hypothetical protein
MLRERLRAANIMNYKDFRGHSYRRGAVQHASDDSLLQSDIETLGRWSSDAC